MGELAEKIEHVDFYLTPAQVHYLEWGQWGKDVPAGERMEGVCFAAVFFALKLPASTMVVLMATGTKAERRVFLDRFTKAVDNNAVYEPLTDTYYLSNGAKILLVAKESKDTLKEAACSDHRLAGAGMLFFEE